MSDAKLAKSLFDRWAAELMNKDKKWDKVKSNFEELFYEFSANSVSFDEAEKFIKEAIAKHLPSLSTAKFIYKNYSLKGKDGKTFPEFFEDWKRGISDFAYQAFYTFYSVDIDKEDPSDGEKIYGNMSKQEYLLQRKYAESFPEVDIIALREQRQKMLELTIKEEKDGDKSNG